MAGRGQKLSSARTAYLEQKIKRHNETIRTERLALCGRITLKNIPLFVVTYGLLLFVRGALAQYSVNTMVHIGRHYRMPTKETNFLVGADKIGFAVSLIFVVYYGNKIHKPLALLCSSVVCACAAILCALPYFLETDQERPSALEGLKFYDAGLCQRDRNQSTSRLQCSLVQPNDRAFLAFSVLATANFMLGVANSFHVTLGIIYIEEAAPSDKSAFYFGLVFFLYSFGEFLGLMAAWQLTNISLDLSGPLELSQWDTGAWWLGFVVIASLFLFVPIPFILYPKWIDEPRWLVLRRTRKMNRLLKHLENERKQLKKSTKKKKKKSKRGPQDEHPDSQRNGIRTNSAPSHTNRAFSGDELNVVSSSTNHASESTKYQTSGDKTGPGVSSASDYVLRNQPSSDDALQDEPPSDDALQNEPPSDDALHNEPPSDDALHNEPPSDDALHNEPPSDDALQNEPSNVLPDAPLPIVAPVETGTEYSQDQMVDRMLQMEEPDNPKSEDNPSEGGQVQTKAQKRQHLLGRRLKDLPRNLWFLMRRPVFMLMVAATVCGAYSGAGFRPTVHTYMETRFPVHQPPGFVVTGAVYTLSTSAAVLVAGCVLYGRTLSLTAHVKVLMILYAVSTVLYLLMMIPGCKVTYAIEQERLSNESLMCNSRCDCSDSQYNPLCASDGTAVVFPSPCHAGCRDTAIDPEAAQMVYSRCSCAPVSALSSSYCDLCSSGRVGYSMLLMLATFCQGLGYISLLQIYLRCITPKLRSLALGFAFWIIHLAASVPGFAAYTALQQTTCTRLVKDCYDETVCWNYHLTALGYIQNGVTATFHFLSLGGFVSVFIVLRRRIELAGNVTNVSYNENAKHSEESGTIKSEKRDAEAGFVESAHGAGTTERTTQA